MEPAAIVDTSAIIDIIKGQLNVDDLPAEEIYICSPVRYELLVGAEDERTRKLILELPCIDLDCEAARIAGVIQRMLYESGEPAGNMDVLIAATCIAENLPLVTRDEGFKRFERFGLRIITP